MIRPRVGINQNDQLASSDELRDRNRVPNPINNCHNNEKQSKNQQATSCSNSTSTGKKEIIRRSVLDNVRSNHTPANLRFSRHKASFAIGPNGTTRSSDMAEVVMRNQRRQRIQAIKDTIPMNKQIILDILDSKMVNHKYLFIKHNKKANSVADEEPVKFDDFKSLEEINFALLNLEEFRDLSCKGKTQSLKFQEFVSACSESTLKKIKHRVVPDLQFILKNDYGNYLIQRIIKRDPSFSALLEAYFKKEFFDLAINEYSSRAMQSLLYQSDAFRLFVLKTLEKRIDLCYTHISVAFLLSVSIAQAKGLPEIEFYRNLILTKIESVLASKFMKRVAVSLLEKLRNSDLDIVFEKLNIGCNLEKYLSDKYYTYILLVFVQNCHSRTMTSLVGLIQYKLFDLLQTKYFKFMMLSLVQQERTQAVFVINSALSRACPYQLQKLAAHDFSYIYFYSYMVVLTTPDSDLAGLRRFMNKMTANFQLAGHLRKF